MTGVHTGLIMPYAILPLTSLCWMLASVFRLNIADPAAGAGGGHGKLQVHVMQFEAQEIEHMEAMDGFQYKGVP